MPKLKIPLFGFGAPLERTLAGPPESTIPKGFSFLISVKLELYGITREYTFASRIRRAITWVY